jgi:hypothetical protein
LTILTHINIAEITTTAKTPAKAREKFEAPNIGVREYSMIITFY